ncbi:uncharacterized protein MONBRDRAFT_10088 [Monosiga brevicollis MX1]|uniref:30S ribosomal protein S16 n=1 Tax=Monosiga brevicollis TaxID=81824 RepID=A9V570_MONBE|nr:uncharacterized protein MONBRDRAFT_10088 [Monosiga brevicollis MX1]EDQ87327.1 predicted protein [Monosiga brevicollis MX1]|eukprot:XP_001747940.1 hypothetical protein [Monosiga brevicollis MX1]
MPVALRLQRFGARHRPFFRIVAADQRSPRDGKHLERLGTYDPIPRADGSKVCSFDFARIRSVPALALQYFARLGARRSALGARCFVPALLSSLFRLKTPRGIQ